MVIAERLRGYNSVGPTASKIAITTLVDQLKAEQEHRRKAAAEAAASRLFDARHSHHGCCKLA
jgi:hypothetical protein